MSDPDLLRLFAEPLEEAGLDYLITGAVAAAIYGEPRFTRDLDLVLELPDEGIEGLSTAFGGGGYYVPPVEALAREVGRERGGHFNLIHRDTALRADVYLMGDDPLHAWAFEGRRRIASEGLEVWVAPIEYVIVRKLEYFRASGSDRQIRDVATMLRVSAEGVDWEALRAWIEEMGLEEELERAKGYEG